jgi:hypothetical protein
MDSFIYCWFIHTTSGLLSLLFAHDKAMKVMKSAGVKVGFMGADPNSI